MDPLAFERFLGSLWGRMGWETTVTDPHHDGGVDVVAQQDRRLLLIQAKRYAPGNPVGASTIGQVLRARAREPVDRWDWLRCQIVTTSHFTDQCREEAHEMIGIQLVNGQRLVDLVERRDAWDLFEEHWNSEIGRWILDAGSISVEDLYHRGRAHGYSFDDVDQHIEWLEEHEIVYRSDDTVYAW